MNRSTQSSPETPRFSREQILRNLKAQARAEKTRRKIERAWKGDFIKFAEMLEIIPRSGVLEKLKPNPIQAAFQAARTARDIVLKPRQVGLTTWELARDIWFLLTRPGARVRIVCQSMSDDAALKECSEKLELMFAALRSVGLAKNVEQHSTSHWSVADTNASLKIIPAGASDAAAKKKGRSGTIHRLHVTELALFEYARTSMNAILGCVPDDPSVTEITIESTALGASGLFYEMYQGAKTRRTSFKPHFYSWLELPEYRTPLAANDNIVPETPREKELLEKYGASLEQLKWFRQKVIDNTQDLVDQEFPTDEDRCWLTDGRVYFDKERTNELLAKTIAPIETRQVGKEGSQGVLRVWVRPAPKRAYVVILDPSEGVGGDPGAGVVLDNGTGEHVATIHGQFSTWEMARVAVEIAKIYNGAQIAVERNNHGHAVLQALVREQKYWNLYVGIDKKVGWNNSEVSRAAALAALHNAHREKHWSSPERESVREMLHFVIIDGKPQAAPGAHDDLVLAHAIGWDVVCRPSSTRFVPYGFVA